MGQTELPSTPATENWQLIEKIAASRGFARAPQVKAMLLFISRRTLVEGATEISETEIACTALGRRPGFDPKEDNIVRVQAHQLRSKLDKYFSEEGRDEPVIVTLPKRTYVPRFELRSAEAEPPDETDEAPAPGKSFLWLYIAAAIAVAFFVGTRFAGSPDTGLMRRVTPANPLLARIFLRDQTTTIVVADNGLTAVQDLLNKNVTLEEYVRPDYASYLLRDVPEDRTRQTMALLLPSQMTSLADAIVSARLSSASRDYGAHVAVRSSRALNVRDLNSGNFVMVGSKRAVPWGELFEDRLNFFYEGNPNTLDFWIANRSPKPGEEARYRARKDSSNAFLESYANLALLPGPGSHGEILVMCGLTMDATESAANFAESGTLPPDAAEWMRDPHHYAEFLLRTRGVPGQTWNVSLVAWRKIREGDTRPARRPSGHPNPL